MQYYIINGSGTSGKDTFVDMIAREIHWETIVVSSGEKTINIENISTIDPIRDAFEDYLGIDVDDKTEGLRLMLSETKKLWVRFYDGPFKAICGFCESVQEDFEQENFEHIIFIHSREPKEIQRFKEHFGEECKTILVDAGERVQEITSNDSDKNVKQYDYDIIIDNSGTLDDLEKQAHAFIKTL